VTFSSPLGFSIEIATDGPQQTAKDGNGAEKPGRN